MYALKQSFLIPGLYYDHLVRWLNEFSSKQFFLIDSDIFKKEPSFYLRKLQEFLGLKNFIDFESLKENLNLQYESFENKKHEIDQNSLNYLQKFYVEPNKKLNVLLKQFNDISLKWLT